MAKSDLVRYKCYSCGKQLKLPAKKIDSGVKCPKCKSPVTNNPPAETPPPADADQMEEVRPPRARRSARPATSAPTPPPDDADQDSDDVVTAVAASTPAPEDDDSLDDDIDPPFDEDAGPEDDDDAQPAPAASRQMSTKRRGGGDAGARMTSRAGTAALQRLAGLAPLLGVLYLLACGAIAGYYVSQGGAAVMATDEREAMFNAVFFGSLGVIGFIVLFTCGKLAKGLVAVANLVGDLRDELRDH